MNYKVTTQIVIQNETKRTHLNPEIIVLYRRKDTLKKQQQNSTVSEQAKHLLMGLQ